MLLKGPSDLKKFVNDVNKNANDNAFDSSISGAGMLFIIPAISQALYDELDEQYNADPADINELNLKIFPFIQSALSHYTMYLDLQTRIGTVGNSGYVEDLPERTSQIRQWVHFGACKNHYFLAEAWLDRCLEFMESKVGVDDENYQLWEDSSAYTFTTALFFSGTSDFQVNGKVDIGNSRSTFLALRPWIDIAEKIYIRPILGDVLYNSLKEKIKEGELNEDEKKLILYIKMALGQWTMYDGLTSLRVSKSGASVRVVNTNDAITQALVLTREETGDLQRAHKAKAEAFNNMLIDYLDATSTADLFPSYYEKVVAKTNYQSKPIHKNECRKSFML